MVNNFKNLTLFIESLNAIVDKSINHPEEVTKEEADFVNFWREIEIIH